MIGIKKQRLLGSFIPHRMPFDFVDALESPVIKLANLFGLKKVPGLALELIVEQQDVERMNEIDESVASVAVLHKIKRQIKTIKFPVEFL